MLVFTNPIFKVPNEKMEKEQEYFVFKSLIPWYCSSFKVQNEAPTTKVELNKAGIFIKGNSLVSCKVCKLLLQRQATLGAIHNLHNQIGQRYVKSKLLEW